MSETPNPQFHRSDTAFLTVLTTEHYNLQSARFATISDSNGRASLFLSSVSSSLVALAFIGQAAQFGEAFRVFGLVLFPVLCVLGLFTFKRVLQSAVDDIVYDFGINLIRHFYAEMAPDATPYFVLSTHDDGTGMMRAMGARNGFGQLFHHRRDDFGAHERTRRCVRGAATRYPGHTLAHGGDSLRSRRVRPQRHHAPNVPARRLSAHEPREPAAFPLPPQWRFGG